MHKIDKEWRRRERGAENPSLHENEPVEPMTLKGKTCGGETSTDNKANV